MENTKSLSITCPEGFEIDIEKSDLTKGLVLFKKTEPKYPLSIKEVKNRFHFIDINGVIHSLSDNNSDDNNDPNNLSSESRAKAFLALMQLIELRDAWNKIDKSNIDFTNIHINKYSINVFKNVIGIDTVVGQNQVLSFGSKETRDLFLETFRDLIETAKELL